MKKTTLIVLSIVFHFTLYGQTNKTYRKALRTIDLKEKISLLTEVIKLEPKKLDAYFYRAIAKNDLGDYHGAIVDYSKIIVEKPDADTYYNRGNSRYSIKDFVGAKNDYTKAFELDKNFVDALYSLACVKFDLDDFEGAIKDFGKVIKMNPHIPMVYTIRADAFKAIKDYENALKHYSLAVIVNPDSKNYYNRGEYLMEFKYYKEANNDFNKSIRLNRNNPFAYFYRGVSSFSLGNFVEAISDFNIAIKFDNKDFDAYLGLAMSYNKINDIKNAKVYFDKANEIISTTNPINSIQVYANTYWFQNHYFYFNNAINSLAKIK